MLSHQVILKILYLKRIFTPYICDGYLWYLTLTYYSLVKGRSVKHDLIFAFELNYNLKQVSSVILEQMCVVGKRILFYDLIASLVSILMTLTLLLAQKTS